MNHGLLAIYILTFLQLLVAANQHGKQSTTHRRFYVEAPCVVINLTLIWWALGWRFW